MVILGLDYGDKKVGIAISDGPLAEPLEVIKYSSEKFLLNSLQKIITENKVKKIIIGKPDNPKKQNIFGDLLNKKFNLPVIYQDETLTTNDAITLSQQSGMKRIKRREKEDAFAATLILQKHLDKHP